MRFLVELFGAEKSGLSDGEKATIDAWLDTRN